MKCHVLINCIPELFQKSMLQLLQKKLIEEGLFTLQIIIHTMPLLIHYMEENIIHILKTPIKDTVKIL